MDAKLLVLKRIFEAVRIPPELGNVSDRKLKQKAIYLCQIIGLDLGYRFGWYLMGPYSPSLARDYYALADEVDGEGEQPVLNEATKNQLRPLLQLLDNSRKPADLSIEAWYELLASWHYLRNVSKKDDAAARLTIRQQKPHIANYIDNAVRQLTSAGL